MAGILAIVVALHVCSYTRLQGESHAQMCSFWEIHWLTVIISLEDQYYLSLVDPEVQFQVHSTKKATATWTIKYIYM